MRLPLWPRYSSALIGAALMFEGLRRFLLGFPADRQLVRFYLGLVRLGCRVEARFHPRSAYRAQRQESSFDRQYGVQTSGVWNWRDSRTGSWTDSYAVEYVAASPALPRRMLQTVADPAASTFIDYGCGKGRVLIVASEFPFKAIVGVEKAPELARTAAANAAIIGEKYPDRTPITAVEGDAATFVLPAGDLVIYLSHPFWKPVMRRVVRTIEAALRSEPRRITVIYCGALLRSLFDRSPLLITDPERSVIFHPADDETGPWQVAVWNGIAPGEREASVSVTAVLRRYLFGLPWHHLLAALMPARGSAAYRELREASAFDRSYGIETAGLRSWRQITSATARAWSDAYGTGYTPSPPAPLRHALRLLPDLQDFTFIDIGCGMGRALAIAGEFPFKAVIGIEKSPELVGTAKANARILGERHTGRMLPQVIEEDAAAVSLPGGNLVIYLNDPFLAPVMAKLVRTIEMPAQEPRRIFVVYLTPRLRGLFDRSAVLTADLDRSFVFQGEDEESDPWAVGVWRNRTGADDA